MRRIVAIVPDLVGEPSVLRQKLPSLERLTELGEMVRISPLPRVETPEALYLGLDPKEGQLRQGPLTVSALGADPPDRSTHFHLSLLSLQDGVITQPKFEPSPEELRIILELAEKLNTKSLTVVNGEGLDHGLVWEALGDLRTHSAAEVEGRPIAAHLPEGDAEVALRRFIDDSVNLLMELEMNERRLDEDLPPFNLLWPWGDGVRVRIPNLALRRGEPALVQSGSMRLEGLTRLAGYRHGARSEFGRGTNVRLEKIVQTALAEPVSLILIESVAEFRRREQIEEAEWFASELDKRLLAPILDEALRSPARLTILSPGDGPGLGVTFETGRSHANSIPFDERALEERSLAQAQLHEVVDRNLSSVGSL